MPRSSLQVMEHQYQDAVRRGIGDLYLAYVNVLAARRTVHFARRFARGTDEYLRATEELYRKNTLVLRRRRAGPAESGIAAVSLMDAEETLRKAKRSLAVLLNLPPVYADRLELRGALEDAGPAPPSQDELIHLALQCRPDVSSFRLGVEAAEAAYQLARANRFQDAYLLYQPFTFQNNAPFGTQSATSWALGLTVPLPVYNRNQGNIERARINITQSQVQLNDRERQVVTRGPAGARASTRSAAGWSSISASGSCPPLKRAIAAAARRCFKEGEVNMFAFLNQKRNYNEKREGLSRLERAAPQGDADAQHGRGTADPAVSGESARPGPERHRPAGSATKGARGGKADPAHPPIFPVPNAFCHIQACIGCRGHPLPRPEVPARSIRRSGS